MKALTLWRPWPWAIFHAPLLLSKPIENRGWEPPAWILGKQIAIHSGQTVDEPATEAAILRRCGWPVDGARPVYFWSTGIVGLVTVKGFFRSREEVADTLGLAAEVWWIGEYAWHFTDRIALPKPVPCKGFQKLWNLPTDVERQVLAQL